MKKTIIALMVLSGIASAAEETVVYTLSRAASSTWGDSLTQTAGTGITFNETDDILTLQYLYTAYSGTGDSAKDSWITPQNAAYTNTYSPSAQLKGGTDTVTLSFRITNTSEQAITLNALSFDVYCMTGTGGDKTNDNEKYNVYASINGGTASVLSAGRKGGVGTVGFDTDIDLAAGEYVDVSYSMKYKEEYPSYYGLTGGSVVYSIIPEPATATLSLLALAGLAARRRRK